jgi:DNA-binding PadR family transcriptional regulator
MSVRQALLALLSDGPKYGLQLRQEFEEWTGGLWRLNVGQVYSTLRRLERDLQVTCDGESEPGPHKTYRITDAGAAELDRWLRSPPDLSVPPRDELIIKTLLTIQMPSVDVHALIKTHRRHVVETMQQTQKPTRIKPKPHAGTQEVSRALVTDAELFRLDSVVRWLDTAESRLRRLQPERPWQPATQETP